MRKHLLLICVFAFFTSTISTWAACTIQPISTQSDVDNFSTKYPGCTVITNGIDIVASSVQNLDGFSSVTAINGLNLEDNPLLVSISGLLNAEITGTINIDNNALLPNLNGLGKVTVVNQFRVVYNPLLTSIAGAGNLSQVNGYFSVGANALENLTGLENLQRVAGPVSLGSNSALTNLDGLSGLKSIGGFLYIGANPMLKNLLGLSSLLSLEDYLTIDDNDMLQSLSGLDNVDLSGNLYVKIVDCASLSVCQVKSICLFVGRSSSANVSNNAPGCLTRAQIRATSECQTALPVTLISFSGKSTPEGNQLTWKTTWEENNAGFDIEKSANAIKFDQVGFLNGVGTSNESNIYHFTDAAPFAVTYYRLKQTDLDNTFSYSKTIVVKRTDEKMSSSEMTVYPNPSNGQLFVKTNHDDVAYSIQTLTGKTVKKGVIKNNKPIETSSLENGLYLITVGKETMKVVVGN